MSGHTKGPWVAHGRYIKQDFSFAGLGEESGCCIANIPGGDNSGPFFIESNAECEANARRIVECVNGYDALLDRIAVLEKQAEALIDITLIAHFGGLANVSEGNALIAIRSVTLPFFNDVSHCTIQEQERLVNRAMIRTLKN